MRKITSPEKIIRPLNSIIEGKIGFRYEKELIAFVLIKVCFLFLLLLSPILTFLFKNLQEIS